MSFFCVATARVLDESAKYSAVWLSDARGKEKRLDKTTDKLFPEG